MDVVIPFRHSRHEDEELRYVLRSIEQHFAEAGKVWILGDRPEWLTADRRVVECVPHEAMSRPFRLRTPVRNYFLLTFLGSVIPELSSEYVQAMDDSVLVAPVDKEFLRPPRAFEDLSKVKNRGQGPWCDSLWRTHDTLLRLGYPAINYESHILHVLYRKWVWNAYRDLSDFASEDPHFGFVGPTAIFNYRMKHEPFELTWLLEEGKFIGFYQHGVTGVSEHERRSLGLPTSGLIPPAPVLLTDQIRGFCRGKTFLNFDDASFTVAMHQFLDDEFPEPSRFERDETSVPGWGELEGEFPGLDELQGTFGHWSGTWPEIIMPSREDFPAVLHKLGLVGEGVEVGTLRGDFAAGILSDWQGIRLHCVDPWRNMSDDPEYNDRNNVPQAVHDRNCAITTEKLSTFGDRCKIWRMTSAEAAVHFPDGSLDFVYLDAKHHLAAMNEDLQLWAPKVRPSGVLCGHDYLDGVLPSGMFQVKSAVDKWAVEHGLEVKTSGEPIWRSWFIRI